MSWSFAVSGLFAMAEASAGRNECPKYSLAAVPICGSKSFGNTLFIKADVASFQLENIKTGRFNKASLFFFDLSFFNAATGQHLWPLNGYKSINSPCDCLLFGIFIFIKIELSCLKVISCHKRVSNGLNELSD